MTKYITYRDDGVAMIPFIVAESIATSQKTKIKRLICTLVLTLFLLIFTNILWLQIFIHAYHDYNKLGEPHIEEEVESDEKWEDIQAIAILEKDIAQKKTSDPNSKN